MTDKKTRVRVPRIPPAQLKDPDFRVPEIPPEPPKPPMYEVDMRSMLFYASLTNHACHPITNPYCEHPEWTAGNADWLYEQMHDADADGPIRRVVFRAICRKQGAGPVGFSTWHPLTEVQREAFRVAVRKWKAEHWENQVGLFFRCRAHNPFIRKTYRIPYGPWLPLDPDDSTAMRWWHQNVAELSEYCDEFWLDGGGGHDPIMREAVKKLAVRVRADTGIKIGIEATPVLNKDGAPTQPWTPDWEYMTHCPAIASWLYVWYRWFRNDNLEAMRMPDEYRGRVECHVQFTDHLGNAPERYGLPVPTPEHAAIMEDAGWVVSWRHAVMDFENPDEG